VSFNKLRTSADTLSFYLKAVTEENDEVCNGNR